MAASQVQLTQGAAPSTPPSGISSIFVDASKRLSVLDDNGLLLRAPTIREAEILAVVPQILAATSATPTGNVSTTEKAMGLGATFKLTPQVTGNIVVIISGMAINATAAGDGTQITGRFGTGAVPANGDTAGLGTLITNSLPQHFVASTTAGQQGFTITGRLTGLALNTQVWFDLSLLAVTGGGSSVKDVQFLAFEI